MAINLRRDAWKDDRQFDDVQNLALELDRLSKETKQRFGEWTPGFTFNNSATGITYGTQAGYYVKAGRTVTCFGHVTMTSNGTGVGAARLTGLPFVVKSILSTTSVGGFGGFMRFTNIGAAMDSLFIYPDSGTKECLIEKIAAAGTTSTSATDTDLIDTFSCVVTLQYLTDDP